MLRLSSSSQDRRSVAFWRSCNNKKDNLIEKKLRFEPQSRQKIGFLGDYRSTLKRFGFLLWDSDAAHTHRIVAQLDLQGVTTIKKAILYIKKMRFERQRRQKNGFSGVFRSALKRFAILLYNSDNAQAHKKAAHLMPHGVRTIKGATLFRKKTFWAKLSLLKILFSLELKKILASPFSISVTLPYQPPICGQKQTEVSLSAVEDPISTSK